MEPGPICSRPSSPIEAIASACASKSLMMITSSSDSAVSMSFGLITHPALVSGISSALTGPATAMIAERGWTEVLSRMLVCSASSMLA
ncbi:hypothetical protein D3C87_1879410 [compost metagenome]